MVSTLNYRRTVFLRQTTQKLESKLQLRPEHGFEVFRPSNITSYSLERRVVPDLKSKNRKGTGSLPGTSNNSPNVKIKPNVIPSIGTSRTLKHPEVNFWDQTYTKPNRTTPSTSDILSRLYWWQLQTVRR